MAPDLSLPSRPRRCHVSAGAERSRDLLQRDGQHGGKEPERHPQLSRARGLGHPRVHAWKDPYGRGQHGAGGHVGHLTLSPCTELIVVPPHTPVPCLGTCEGCHPVLAQV